MLNTKNTKWVACWGNATSITDRTEATYAKDITLRYPIEMCFSGEKIRLHFSNLTGDEPITISNVVVRSYDNHDLLFAGEKCVTIPCGQEIVSDELAIEINAGDMLIISMYLADFTQMNAGTLVTGPMSSGQFCYGNHAYDDELPIEQTRNTNWFYFLNTVDIFTQEKNHALICYGDSITAQSWPDYLKIRAKKEGYSNVSIIRRAVCGTRILRQYDCATYAAYGLKGATRFCIETKVAGADTILIQHGINDIIHPVGTDVNVFRPWEDLPTLEELTQGFTDIYVNEAKRAGLKVWAGTLLPIYGWRTYAPFREELKNDFNNWIRSNPMLDGVVDFDECLRSNKQPEAFAEGFDSGDHLHPSEAAYKAMADIIPSSLLS